jgi:hypothetical protein
VRQKINILWLEDELESSAHEERKEIVNDILEDKGYKAVINEFSNFEEADNELNSVKRYDFFISDFNLDDKKSGLAYLERIRTVNGYKQFVILYSLPNIVCMYWSFLTFIFSFSLRACSSLAFSNIYLPRIAFNSSHLQSITSIAVLK